MHTLCGALRKRPRIPVHRETWDTPDGDHIDVECLPRKRGPGILVIHGLEGSARAPYVYGTLRQADARGWSGFGVSFRSCGPSLHRFPQTYHSGFTTDLAFAVERVRSEGVHPLGLVGFSLGGNVVAKYMAEQGDAAPVAAAVAICVPFDLAACAASLDGPGLLSSFYRWHFLRSLKRKALAKARRFPGSLDADKVRSARTLREFDEHVTARLFGFAGADDYWTQSSSGPLIGRIRKPTLFVSATDDPIVPVESIPRTEIARNANAKLALLSSGGHVGFLSGSLLSAHFAAEEIAASFLAEYLSCESAPPFNAS